MDHEVRLLRQLDARERESFVDVQLFYSMWKLPCKCGAAHVNEYLSSMNYQRTLRDRCAASAVVYKCLIGCVFSSFYLQDWTSDVKFDGQGSE